MTLQLPFFLDVSSNEYITFEIIALIWKKLPKPGKKLRRKSCIQLLKKTPKLNEKTWRENRGLDQQKTS